MRRFKILCQIDMDMIAGRHVSFHMRYLWLLISHWGDVNAWTQDINSPFIGIPHRMLARLILPAWSSFPPSPSAIFSLFLHLFSRLSKWLGTELSSTILLDFPSVLDLATELDHRYRGATGGATNGATTNGTHATAGGYVAEKEDVKLEKLAVDKELLIQVHHKKGWRCKAYFLQYFYICIQGNLKGI